MNQEEYDNKRISDLTMTCELLVKAVKEINNKYEDVEFVLKVLSEDYKNRRTGDVAYV